MRFLSRRERPVQKSRIRESLETLASTVLFVWLFTNHVAQATEVPTESMKPAILPGDHFFLDKVAFPANYPEAVQKYLPLRSVARGDILAFWSPQDREIRLVKRVIGLPGETLEIRDRQVFINGRPLDEPYKVHVDSNALEQRDNLAAVKIPENQYFMMGDNRDNSNDSRFWGFARREDFIGKPTFVYWSFEADPNASPHPTLEDRVRRLASVAGHFFSKTRWLRTGSLVR